MQGGKFRLQTNLTVGEEIHSGCWVIR